MRSCRAGQRGSRLYSTQAPRSVRGMSDRFGLAERKHQHIVSTAQQAAHSYGFEPVHTPILEYSSVFERTLGTDSDVVGKELYKFQDSSAHWMTMRPEGTAGVARALVTNKLDRAMPQMLYYAGPMFRHERPQRGRLRQFEQFGIEAVGIAHPAADVECIQMGWEFLARLGVEGTLELRLNTLGDFSSRAEYRQSLSKYFAHYRDRLSEDSRRRLDTNPLRILDSKHSDDIAIAANAPAYDEFLNAASQDHFKFVSDALAGLGIPFTVDRRLVRGLDYYQHTVWEVVCASELLGRSQATVLAGGRYDGLSKLLGSSQSLPGIGWASGIERLALLLPDWRVSQPPAPIPVLMIPDQGTENGGSRERRASNAVYMYALRVAQLIRQSCSAYVVHSQAAAHQPLGKQLAAVLAKAPLPARVAIVGSDELEHGQVVVRDTATRQQRTVPVNDIAHSFQ